MEVKDILEKCSHLKVEAASDISEDYAERQILAKDIGPWEEILNEMLGPPAKKAGEEVTESFYDLTIGYGGIMEDQTLYYKKFDEKSIIAMIWPWKDQNGVTVKIVSFKEKPKKRRVRPPVI